MGLMTWLNGMNLTQYYNAFVENGFGEQLMAVTELNDDDLKQIGVKLMGHRKLLLREIRVLNEQQTTTPKLNVNIQNMDMLNVGTMHDSMTTPTAAEVEGMYVIGDEQQKETAGVQTPGDVEICYDDENDGSDKQ